MMHRNRSLPILFISMILAAPMSILAAGGEDISAAVSDENNFNEYVPITNIQELSNIRNDLEGKYYLANDIVFGGGIESNFTPIGFDSYSSFTGVFDGNGHVIDGMRVEVNSSEGAYSGLFGYVGESGQIRNLGVVNGSLTAVSSYFAYAGGIAGYTSYSAKMINCYNTGTVSARSASFSHSNACAGGIVGYADPQTEITGCYNTGAVSATSDYADLYAGGIVGYAAYGISVANCYNTGAVSAISDSFADLYAGGIIGRVKSAAEIINCYNTGAVSASPYSYACAGGIVGSALNDIWVTNSYYLEDQLYIDGALISDELCGFGNPTVDGDDAYGRRSDQKSGAKTLAEMTPSLSSAADNASIYFTGSADRKTGWDFSAVWTFDEDPADGLINGGLPMFANLKTDDLFFTISGTVSSEGRALAGAFVTYNTACGIDNSVYTDGNGAYSIKVQKGKTVTINKIDDFGYVPLTLYRVFTSSETADFMINEKLFTVSGYIYHKGDAIANAKITYVIDGGSPLTAHADSNGYFKISVQAGKNLKITKVDGTPVSDPEVFYSDAIADYEVTYGMFGKILSDTGKLILIFAIAGAAIGGLAAAVLHVKKKSKKNYRR